MIARELMWKREKERALEAARHAIAPTPPPTPAPGDPIQPHESPTSFFERVEREMNQ